MSISETLAGRIGYIEVKPFDMFETDNMKNLWLRGGFPLSYLAKTDDLSLEWKNQYIGTFLERDIPNLGISIPANKLRRFWTMLSHYHGQIFNASEIGSSMGISYHTVQKPRHFARHIHDQNIAAMAREFKKRQVKSPKIYFKDSGIYHALSSIGTFDSLYLSKIGASWEGFALEQIISYYNIPKEKCYFLVQSQFG